jgi:cyclic beta-1,2-glucan synthetase
MDRLDRRLSRFLAPDATARCVPEAVKRFTTWAPLLIPFYIPRGKDWDYAWSQSQAIQRDHPGGPFASLVAMPVAEQLMLLAGSVLATTALFAAARWLRARFGPVPRP